MLDLTCLKITDFSNLKPGCWHAMNVNSITHDKN